MNLNVDNYYKIVELKYCTSSLFVSPPKDVKKLKQKYGPYVYGDGVFKPQRT